jgi:WhiB family redox-sensing transcriptional regulator
MNVLQFALLRVLAPEKGVCDMVMALDDELWEPEHSWREDSACSGADSEVFFPPSEDEAAAMAAKKICAACPVQEQCLQYALATNQTEGVWGGLSSGDRRRLRRRIRDRERRKRAS